MENGKQASMSSGQIGTWPQLIGCTLFEIWSLISNSELKNGQGYSTRRLSVQMVPTVTPLIVIFCHSGTPLRFLCFYVSYFQLEIETQSKVDTFAIGEVTLYGKSYTECLLLPFYI